MYQLQHLISHVGIQASATLEEDSSSAQGKEVCVGDVEAEVLDTISWLETLELDADREMRVHGIRDGFATSGLANTLEKLSLTSAANAESRRLGKASPDSSARQESASSDGRLVPQESPAAEAAMESSIRAGEPREVQYSTAADLLILSSSGDSSPSGDGASSASGTDASPKTDLQGLELQARLRALGLEDTDEDEAPAEYSPLDSDMLLEGLLGSVSLPVHRLSSLAREAEPAAFSYFDPDFDIPGLSGALEIDSHTPPNGTVFRMMDGEVQPRDDPGGSSYLRTCSEDGDNMVSHARQH